jgi:hypothetical protein
MLAAVTSPTPAALAEAAAEPATAAVAAVAAVAATPVPAADTISKVLLSTLSDCQLAVSVYPPFAYDAAGGGGTGTVQRRDDGLLHLRFDPASLSIPPINSRHAAILGIPVPPPLNIAIVPRRLEGTLDPATGRVDLDFSVSRVCCVCSRGGAGADVGASCLCTHCAATWLADALSAPPPSPCCARRLLSSPRARCTARPPSAWRPP